MDPIEELLTRGVDKIYPTKEELERLLRSGKKLTLYQGFDPTGTQLHIGHMVGFMKLRQWQDLGHKVIFLIGDGTGQAGDPSGKLKARDTFFTTEQLRENATNYVMQAASIVRFEGENAIEIHYNGDWLNKLKLTDILDIASHFTLQQLSERDLFQERMKRNEPVNLREFLYPLLQGYDSVAMKVDLELGGSDQTFNMLCGRSLVKDYLNKEKYVMTTPLLTDSEGRKIGKTEGNVIALMDDPKDLYRKILALPDAIVAKGFEYLTRVPMEEVQKIKHALDRGEHPMEMKKRLAYDIVEILHNTQAAHEARENFERTVQNKEMPDDIPTFKAQDFAHGSGWVSYLDLLVKTGLADSKSEAKRLIMQGGVKRNSETISNPTGEISLNEEFVLKVGKKFVKIVNN